jgi:hypothetical protein
MAIRDYTDEGAEITPRSRTLAMMGHMTLIANAIVTVSYDVEIPA